MRNFYLYASEFIFQLLMSLYPDKNVNVRKFGMINSNFNIVYRSFWEKDFNTIQGNNAIV